MGDNKSDIIINAIGISTSITDKHGKELKSGDIIVDTCDFDTGIIYYDENEKAWMIKWIDYETPTYLDASSDLIIKIDNLETVEGSIKCIE